MTYLQANTRLQSEVWFKIELHILWITTSTCGFWCSFRLAASTSSWSWINQAADRRQVEVRSRRVTVKDNMATAQSLVAFLSKTSLVHFINVITAFSFFSFIYSHVTWIISTCPLQQGRLTWGERETAGEYELIKIQLSWQPCSLKTDIEK